MGKLTFLTYVGKTWSIKTLISWGGDFFFIYIMWQLFARNYTWKRSILKYKSIHHNISFPLLVCFVNSFFTDWTMLFFSFFSTSQLGISEVQTNEIFLWFQMGGLWDAQHCREALPCRTPSSSLESLSQNKSCNFWLCFPKLVPKGLVIP